MLPSSPARRIVGLDVARCLALLGMIATHTLVSRDAAGEVTWVQQLAGGRSSALFAVLAGVSIALMTGRTAPVRGRDRRSATAGLTVRALIIAVIGLVLGLLGSGIAVILTYYGVLFLLGLPFLGLRARALVALGTLCALAAPVLSQLLRPLLPEATLVSPNLTSLAEPWQLLTELTLTGYYPALPWMTYLFAGMAVGRLDLTRARTGVGLLAAGTLVAAVGRLASEALLRRPGVMTALRDTYGGPAGSLAEELTSGLHGTTPTGSWWWLAVAAPHSGTPFDLTHTAGSAVAVIGGCLLLSRAAPRVIAVVFGAGAMTLTLYTLHVVMRTPQIWYDDSVHNFTRHVLLVLVIGALFRLHDLRGPLETLVRRASEAAATERGATPRPGPPAPR